MHANAITRHDPDRRDPDRGIRIVDSRQQAIGRQPVLGLIPGQHGRSPVGIGVNPLLDLRGMHRSNEDKRSSRPRGGRTGGVGGMDLHALDDAPLLGGPTVEEADGVDTETAKRLDALAL